MGRRARRSQLLAIAAVTAVVLSAVAAAFVGVTLAQAPGVVRASAGERETPSSCVALGAISAKAAADYTPPVRRRITVIAWQPSHQADTGADWQEYVICGDIVDRAIALLPEFAHVKAWETGMGLSGSNGYRPRPKNTPAFDSEVAKANAGSATVFVSIHNDGGAPSGILGMCMPGDTVSRTLAERFKAALVAVTGLPDRGMREERLYSLESERNKAGLRLLLEIGDNKADRAFLLDDDNRQVIAQALADSFKESDLP